jgi:uncharacterized C2H2 Zn-finger protein
MDLNHFNAEQDMEDVEEALEEEYIEEVEEYDENIVEMEEPFVPAQTQEMISDGGDEIEFEVKIEPNQEENKPFVCPECEKPFSSRSGRDTHQQMKHKVPENVKFVDFDNHEVERVLSTGELVRGWKCPTCTHVSSKKNHHQTHMIRHAIREKEETIKQEIKESNLVIIATKTITAEDQIEGSFVIDSSPEQAEKQESATAMVLKPKNIPNASTTRVELPQKPADFSFVCEECSVIFPTEKILKRHQEGHVLGLIRTPLEFFDCPDCAILFSTKKSKDAHMVLHTENEDYQYEHEEVTRFEGYEIVLKTSQNREKLKEDEIRCAYCIKTGPRRDMDLHMALFHANLVCPVCNRNFMRSLGYFVDHMKNKHPDQFDEVQLTFPCPHCSKDFPTKTLMIKHCKLCDAKAFKCNHCDMKFAQERQLKKHKAKVEGVKDHGCSECPKRFASSTELRVHTRCHTKEKPYQCSFEGCTKAFRTNSHLSSHMDLHNPNKSFQCQYCSMKFQTRGARRVHEKSHNLVSAEASTCGLCHKEFRQRSHYVRHVNAVHQIQCNSGNLEQRIGTHIGVKKTSEKESEASEDSC